REVYVFGEPTLDHEMFRHNRIFFFQEEDGIRDFHVTGVQTCALPISRSMMSPDSSGGHLSRVVFTASTTALTGSSIARRTSSAEITTVFGSPLTRSRPRISACGSSSPPG